MAGEGEIETVELSPEVLADKALELRPHGSIGVAYTYNEPLIGYEYVRDCATLVHERGMATSSSPTAPSKKPPGGRCSPSSTPRTST